MAGSPFPGGDGAWGEAIDPSGQFLYTTNSYDGRISMFTVNGTTGALTPVAGSPLVYGTAPTSIAIE
jgi:DNA-binding beta-propeller fold protein YncE